MIARGATRTHAPLLNEADAARALEIAERIFNAALPRLAAEPGAPESIARYGGAVVVAEALARAGRLGEDTVREVLREALVFAPDRLGLYDGAAGLLVAIEAVDPDGASTALAAARGRLRQALAASLHDPKPADFLVPETFDLITGLAGRAIALGDDVPEIHDDLRAFARDFIGQAETLKARDEPHVAASVNLGVAHGVPGVLAALNAALPGDRELGRRYVDFLLECSHEVDGERRWNAVWRRDDRPSPRRAWCYQTAGVAAVLADRALLDDDHALYALARGALRDVLDDRAEDRWDAALCHGRSGVAMLAARFPDDLRLRGHAERLAHTVLDEFDPNAPLGYRTLDPGTSVLTDNARFLDGTLGIAQFLIDAATAQEQRWLRLFGLLSHSPT
jgi:hypothetical protein